MPLDLSQIMPPPSQHKPDKVLVYKTGESLELKAHIFFPVDSRETGAGPAFVFFHPGGWAMGQPEWGYDICHHRASLGMVAISFQYRLSRLGGCTPLHAVLDARSAVRWTREHASELGIDPGRIVAGGASAGGHIAGCTATLPGPDDPADNLKFSQVPDALVLQCSPMNPAIDNQFIGLLQGAAMPENLSPTHHVRPGLPPMCFAQGTADTIVSYDSIKEFCDKMRAAGNRCDLHTFEGADHFFSSPADRAEAMKVMDDFLVELNYIRPL
jgi:acetyl esterase